MVEEFTPVHIEQRIRGIADSISRSVKVCDERYREAQSTERAFSAAYARAYLDASGPQHEKRYRADLATAAEREARDVAEAAWRYADRLAKALSSELDAYRSLGASVRQAYAVAGIGER
jgi:hypothetical protein